MTCSIIYQALPERSENVSYYTLIECEGIVKRRWRTSMSQALVNKRKTPQMERLLETVGEDCH